MAATRPRTTPKIPPGFEGTVSESKHEPKPVETDIHVALLQQELQLHQLQLAEATRVNTELTGLQRAEAERIFVLVQELAHCERRTAKAEIAVEYLSELNVQISAKIKRLEEPDQRVCTLEKQLQNAKYDAEMRISVLEMEIQNLSQDNERFKSKLENAMDTIMAFSSLQERTITAQVSGIASRAAHTARRSDHHNNLIDLMDDCLTPVKNYMAEEQTTTLLDDSYDPDDDAPQSSIKKPQVPPDSFDSDFSNSSYIVRFKGIRDMTKGGIVMDTTTMVRNQSNPLVHVLRLICCTARLPKSHR